MRMSVIEGALYSVWFGLIAGNYLTGLLLHLHATGLDLGIVAALPSLAMLPQVAFVGRVRAVSDRRWICGGLGAIHRLGWVVGGLASLFLPRPWDLITFECAYGLAWLAMGPVNVAWSTYMDDIVAMPVRGWYFGWRAAATQVAALVGVLLGGLILQDLPGSRGFLVLMGAGLLAGIGNVAMWPLHPRVAARAVDDGAGAGPPRPGLQAAGHTRPSAAHRRASVFFAAWAFVQSLAVPFFPVALEGPLRLSFGELGLLSALAGLATALGAAAVGRWQDRRGELGVIAAGMLLLSTPPVLLWSALRLGTPLLLLAHVVFGVGTGLVMVSTFTLNLRLAPAGSREMHLAIWYAVTGFGALVAPLLAGPLTLHFIWPLFAVASAGSLLLTALWRWWIGPSCLGAGLVPLEPAPAPAGSA
jgi:MFS family permease